MQVGYEKVAVFDHYLPCCRCCDREIYTVPPDRGNLVTLIAGSSKRRSLLMVAERRQFLFITRSLEISSKTTVQHLTVCSGKSETKVTVLRDRRQK